MKRRRKLNYDRQPSNRRTVARRCQRPRHEHVGCRHRLVLAIMQPNFAAYDAVAAMPDYLPTVKYPRTPGYKPEGEENKYNAWYVKTTVKGAPAGKLAGKTLVLKDNVCLAGVPM